MYDYHVHSTFSGDSKMSMISAVEKSIEVGLKEIVFTDHLDIFWPDQLNVYERIQPKKYHNLIEKAKKLYGNQISIKKGLEIGIQPHSIIETNNFLKGWDYDFIILSIHCVDKIDVSQKMFYLRQSSYETFKRYYEEVLFAVKEFQTYNVLGHLDLIRRHIPNPSYKKPFYSEFYEIIDQIFKILINKNKGIEVNTSGYRYGLDTFMPDFDLIKRYRELGGKIITVGSDAHSTEYIGYKINEAIELIKQAGFEHITLFDNMNPHFCNI